MRICADAGGCCLFLCGLRGPPIIQKRQYTYSSYAFCDWLTQVPPSPWPLQTHVFAPADSHPQLQAILAIQPANTLAINPPAFPAQHHVEPSIAESGSRLASSRSRIRKPP